MTTNYDRLHDLHYPNDPPRRGPWQRLADWWDGRHIRKSRRNAPRSITEAADRMLAEAPPDILARFKDEHRQSCIVGFGFGSGMGLRNGWDLWRTDSPLTRELAAAGIMHGDDRSAVLFTALWCRLNDVPFRIEDEAARYKAHWEAHGCAMDGSPLPGRRQQSNHIVCVSKDGTCHTHSTSDE